MTRILPEELDILYLLSFKQIDTARSTHLNTAMSLLL